jgi:uncharacterized membrane protein
MYNLLLFLHLLAVIFAIGPLVGAASTAARALRTPDAAAAASAARTLKVYGYASVVVVVFGMGLMSAKDPDHPSQHVASFGDTWIWLSVLLWLVAMGLTLGALEPTLRRVAAEITSGQPVATLTGRVAALGGGVALIFAGIIALMVFQPGG